MRREHFHRALFGGGDADPDIMHFGKGRRRRCRLDGNGL
jgi:hypothetical protein